MFEFGWVESLELTFEGLYETGDTSVVFVVDENV
jgi:hypothetical protein